jgi:hypothetical protein
VKRDDKGNARSLNVIDNGEREAHQVLYVDHVRSLGSQNGLPCPAERRLPKRAEENLARATLAGRDAVDANALIPMLRAERARRCWPGRLSSREENGDLVPLPRLMPGQRLRIEFRAAHRLRAVLVDEV